MHGREPTQASVRASQSTPRSNGLAASTIALMRRGSGGAFGRRNSIIPATRNPTGPSGSTSGVHATRCAGKYTGFFGFTSGWTVKL